MTCGEIIHIIRADYAEVLPAGGGAVRIHEVCRNLSRHQDPVG